MSYRPQAATDAAILQGKPVTSPILGNDGQALVYNHGDGLFEYADLTGVGGTVAMGGDVTGDSDTCTVAKIQNVPVPAPTVAEDGQFLQYDDGTGEFVYGSPVAALVAMGGDVTGDSDDCTVVAIQNTPVPAPTVAEDGLFLQYDDNTGEFIYAAGGGSSVTMGGDVTGNSATTTVEKIRGKNVPDPGAGEDEKFLKYDHDTTAFVWATPAGGGGTEKGIDYFRQVGTSPLERWYVAGILGSVNSMTTASVTTGVLRAVPFVTTRGVTLDRIAVRSTVNATGAVCRIGIYAATSETDLYPGARVLDSGEIDISSAGLKSVTVNQALSANTLYWFVHLGGTANVTMHVCRPESMWNIFGVNSTMDTTSFGLGITVAQSYGVLPDPFTSAGTVITAAPIPAIAMRFSA